MSYFSRCSMACDLIYRQIPNIKWSGLWPICLIYRQIPNIKLILVHGLLGIRPHSRRWAEGRHASITAYLTGAPPLVISVAALDSHGSTNPLVSCACRGSRLNTLYENLTNACWFEAEEFHPNPKTIPQPPTCGLWKICLPGDWSLVPKRLETTVYRTKQTEG